jgi:predicted  nucleic acid-binding Zn-ribbon protein
MTLLGKCLTALILILSVGFAALALVSTASHKNWRDVVIKGENGQLGLKAQIERISNENQQLTDQKARALNDLAREQVSRKTALAALQTQLNRFQAELSRSGAEVEALTSQVTKLVSDNETKTKELETLNADNDRLRAAVRDEQEARDQLFATTIQLTDKMNILRGFKQTLERRNKQLMTQATRFQEVIAARGIDINEPLDGAPPERNGNILQIDRPSDLVLVSIGSDEGLRPGHFLEVTRKGRYVGKLKVRKAEPDRSVAEIMKDYSEGILQEGDRVDTTLD